MAALCAALPFEGFVLGTTAGWWRQEVEWCSSFVSMTPNLGGMAQRDLGDGCAKKSSRRAGAPLGAVVASMASLMRGFTSV
jgi:hypothetical protein